MEREKVIELLKSGKFTIAYHDQGYCTIHKGKISYEETGDDQVRDCDNTFNGYIPEIVQLLTEALKGWVVSV